jgi:hypothetical protein
MSKPTRMAKANKDAYIYKDNGGSDGWIAEGRPVIILDGTEDQYQVRVVGGDRNDRVVWVNKSDIKPTS